MATKKLVCPECGHRGVIVAERELYRDTGYCCTRCSFSVPVESVTDEDAKYLELLYRRDNNRALMPTPTSTRETAPA